MGNRISAEPPRYVGTPRFDLFKTGDLVFFGNAQKDSPGAPIVWEHVGIVFRFPTLYEEQCETLLLEYADEYHEKLDDYSCMHRPTDGVRLVNLETRVKSASHQVIDIVHCDAELSKTEVEIFSAMTELLKRPGDELGRTDIVSGQTNLRDVSRGMSMPEMLARVMTSLELADSLPLKKFSATNLYRNINDISRLDFHYHPPLRVKNARAC
jgi:hypothetical protein